MFREKRNIITSKLLHMRHDKFHILEVHGRKCQRSFYFLAKRKQPYESLVRLSNTKSKGRI